MLNRTIDITNVRLSFAKPDPMLTISATVIVTRPEQNPARVELQVSVRTAGRPTSSDEEIPQWLLGVLADCFETPPR